MTDEEEESDEGYEINFVEKRKSDSDDSE